MSTEKIYHYTSLFTFKEIYEDEEIKVSAIDKCMGWEPAVWFTKNKAWETTANKTLMSKDSRRTIFLTTQEQHDIFGLVRIGIDFSKALYSWEEYKYLGNIHLADYEWREDIGNCSGSDPKRDWYCSFENVPRHQWVVIELYEKGIWVDLSDHLKKQGGLFFNWEFSYNGWRINLN
jgi:hypothetical protein